MPKPKDKKHSFDAQVQSALAGARIVPQNARLESESGRMERAPQSGQLRTPEARVVEKLIDFFKTMD